LNCRDNQLTEEKINEIFEYLPILQWDDTCIKICSGIKNNPGASICDRSIAISKGWMFN
jgi:hypothetical protein